MGVRLAVIGDGSSASGGAPAAGTAEPPCRPSRRHAATARAAPGTAASAATAHAPAPAHRPATGRDPRAGRGGGRQRFGGAPAVADRAQAPGRERHQRVRGDGDRARRAHHPRGRLAGGRVAPFGGPAAAAGPAPARRHRPRRPPAAPGAPAMPVASVRPHRRSPWRRSARAGDQVVPFSNMRRRTAEHMVRSKATSPTRLHRQRGRLRGGRAVARGLGRALQGRGGVLTDLPAVRRPCGGRGAAGLPAPQRVGGRRLAARARRGQSRDRGRPRPTRA